MKHLELKKKKEVTTLQEEINGVVISYEFEKELNEEAPKSVTFYTMLDKGMVITGGYTISSGLYLNATQGVTASETVLITEIVNSVIAIIEGDYTTSGETYVEDLNEEDIITVETSV